MSGRRRITVITDPKFAPARPELTFLRRRVRPKQQPAPAPPAAPAASTPPAPTPPPSTPRAAASAPSGSKIDYTRRDRTPPPATPPPARPASPPPRPATPPPARTPSPPASGGGSLDLSNPTGPSSGSVDYTRPGAPSSPSSSSSSSSSSGSPSAASSSSSLDLSGGAGPGPSPRRATPPTPQPLPAWLEKHVTRVGERQQHIMSVQAPTVTLTRVQSGVGELTIEAFCSPEIGDLRLGAAYQLRSGGSGIVQHADGNRFGPSSRRPVIVGSREEYEHLGVDLRQVHDVERIAVYAYSQSRTTITWGGTLVVGTVGGARLELPLERLYPGPLAVLMTFYNMDGELVVRAEMENIAGDIREAARAYGFDRITWRDGRTPVE